MNPRVLVFCTLLWTLLGSSALGQPLIPFRHTGNLYVLEHGCGCILEITDDGNVSVAVTKAEILALTGESDVDFNSQGLAFTPDGTMYFIESIAEVVMKRTCDGTLSIVGTEAQLLVIEGIFRLSNEIDMDSITVGLDGNVYIMDETNQLVLRYDPEADRFSVLISAFGFLAAKDPAETSVQIESGIVAGLDGLLYAFNEQPDTPGAALPGVISICTNGEARFVARGGLIRDPDEYNTRAPNGDIIITDDDPQPRLLRMTPEGDVSVFLSNAQIAAAAGGPIADIDGGLAFDGFGNFFFSETENHNILRFDPDGNGSIWVSRSEIMAATGVEPSLDGTIAFSPEYKLFFAQFADGLGLLFSQITLYSTDPDETTTAQVILKGDSGAFLTVDLNGTNVTGSTEDFQIPPDGQRIFRTDGEGELAVGSVIVCSNKPLSGVILFAGSVGLAGVGASPLIEDGFTGPVETDGDRKVNTGMALMNLEMEPVTLDFELLDEDGKVVARAQIVLPAMGHKSFFVTEPQNIPWDTPPDFGSFEGTVRVTTSGRISATMLQTRPDQFATLPVTPF